MQYIIQIILALTLIAVIIMQAKGTGLGSSWGGDGSAFHSKRGIEKSLFYLTIIISILFVVMSAYNAF